MVNGSNSQVTGRLVTGGTLRVPSSGNSCQLMRR